MGSYELNLQIRASFETFFFFDFVKILARKFWSCIDLFDGFCVDFIGSKFWVEIHDDEDDICLKFWVQILVIEFLGSCSCISSFGFIFSLAFWVLVLIPKIIKSIKQHYEKRYPYIIILLARKIYLNLTIMLYPIHTIKRVLSLLK